MSFKKAACSNGPITNYVSISGPSHGGWDVGARMNGKYDYIATPGYLGQDAATFQATNSAGQTSQPFVVTLNVFAPGPPQCSDVTLTVPENGQLAIGLDDLQCTGTAMTNMNGPFNGVAHGSGWPVGNGWEYQPNQGYVGDDQGLFDVETTDGTVSNPFTIHFVVGGSGSS